MMPPSTAQYWPSGCSMTATVPGSARSTQCVPAGKPWVGSEEAGSALGMNLKVDAGAMSLGVVVLRPIVGEKGAFHMIISLVVLSYLLGAYREGIYIVIMVLSFGGCSGE